MLVTCVTTALKAFALAIEKGMPNAQEELSLTKQDLAEHLASRHIWAHAWTVAAGRKPLEQEDQWLIETRCFRYSWC